jgi:hypothetical protein
LWRRTESNRPHTLFAKESRQPWYMRPHILVVSTGLEPITFSQEFKKLPYMKGEYNNEYTPIRFKTEEECNNFLNSIGLQRV